MGSEGAQGARREGGDTEGYKPRGQECPGRLARLVGAVREGPGLAVPSSQAVLGAAPLLLCPTHTCPAIRATYRLPFVRVSR